MMVEQVMHTIRWKAPANGDPFAPHGRNAEDLGVEIFSPSPSFKLSFPVIAASSGVSLAPGAESVCSYLPTLMAYPSSQS